MHTVMELGVRCNSISISVCVCRVFVVGIRCCSAILSTMEYRNECEDESEYEDEDEDEDGYAYWSRSKSSVIIHIQLTD